MLDLSVEAALERVLAACPMREAVERPVMQAVGCVLAAEVVAPHALPPFANAGMDGFAVRATDLAQASAGHPVILPVAGIVQAGSITMPVVEPGTAVRIMTGAPIPAGADAVVPIEDITELPGPQVAFTRSIPSGRHVRPAGEDVAAGAVAIPAGRPLRAAEIGLLAAFGVTAVRVVRPPRIAIISTGDELLEPGEPLAPGKIRDANNLALTAFVALQGAEPLPLGIARDTDAALRAKIDAALAQGADMIVTSAGASAGDYDVVHALMEGQARLEVWRVNLKPGRPLLFGRVGTQRAAPLLGLPGNPASALVVAELFLRPAIRAMRGLPAAERRTVRAALDTPQRGSERRHYVRARLEWDGAGYRAITRGIGSGSGALTTLVRSNALLIIPEGSGEIAAGSEVEALTLE
jgi:molybdopterin molybdotransferase